MKRNELLEKLSVLEKNDDTIKLMEKVKTLKSCNDFSCPKNINLYFESLKERTYVTSVVIENELIDIYEKSKIKKFYLEYLNINNIVKGIIRENEGIENSQEKTNYILNEYLKKISKNIFILNNKEKLEKLNIEKEELIIELVESCMKLVRGNAEEFTIIYSKIKKQYEKENKKKIKKIKNTIKESIYLVEMDTDDKETIFKLFENKKDENIEITINKNNKDFKVKVNGENTKEKKWAKTILEKIS